MPKSTLLSHFQSLFASGQHDLALEQLQKLVTSIPLGATRDQVNQMLQSEPTPWQDVVLLLEQTLGVLREEQKNEVLLIIGNENYAFQNIIGSSINIHKLERKPIPKQLTPIPSIDASKDCIGRETELAELHQKLSSSPKVALIRGLGGIGKTTLAMAYVAIHQEQYQHLAWITQGADLISTVALDQSLAESLDKPFQTGENLQSRFVQLMQALRAIPGPNLLVIDNATAQLKASEVFQYLPTPPNWKVLVTSREDLPDDFIKLELQVLPPAAALELFRLYYSGGNDEEAGELLQEIGYHTLMIELMAKTLERQKGLLSIPELLSNFQDKELDDPDLEAKLSARHSGTVEKGLFQYLMRLFNLTGLSEQEIWVMQQFAVLPVLPMSALLLAEWLGKNPKELNRTLQALVDKGWLSSQEDGYVVHRLVQELIKYQQPSGVAELEALIDAMTGRMSQDASSNPVTDNFPWLPYAEKVAAHFSGLEILPEKVSRLWDNLANVLRTSGDYRRAAKLLEQALASAMRNFGEDHSKVAVSRSNLANVLIDLGDYPRAVELHKQALASNLRNFGEDDPSVAVSQSNLASALSHLEDITVTAELHAEALASAVRIFGEDHPSVAASQSNLALVYKDLGYYDYAAKLLELALASDLRNFGEDHLNIAQKQYNLATVYYHKDRLSEAKILLEQASKNVEKNLGQNHPHLTSILSWLDAVNAKLEDIK